MYRKAFLLWLFLFFFILTSSFADDAAYEGDGIDVYPLRNADIQLVSEIITITGAKNVHNDWNVYVDMTFKNHGHDTTVQMGFPLFSTSNPDGEEFDNNFQTWVNGKKVVVAKKHGVPNPIKNLDLFAETVYTYPVAFKRGETMNITHSYRVGGYSSSIGDWCFKYILRTGALWRGPIENLKIFYKTTPEGARNITRITPEEHESQCNGKELILMWEFKNYKPHTDLSISGVMALVSNSLITNNLISADSHKQKLAYDGLLSLRYIRNRIFASYGYPFKKPLIRTQFYYPGSPYKENLDFTMNNITKEDRLFIDYLIKIENWKATLSEKRIQGVLDYEDEVENPQSKFEADLLKPVALNRNYNTMIDVKYEGYLLFLDYPTCIPQKKIRLSSLLSSKHKEVLWNISDWPPVLSLDGRYFAISCSYYACGINERIPVILIIDVVNASVLQMIPSSSLEFYNQIQFSRDSSRLFTLKGAYNVPSGKKIKEWIFPESINQETLELMSVSPDGNILFTSQRDNKIYSLNFNTGKFTVKEIIVKSIEIEKGDSIRLSDFTISFDGKYLAGFVLRVKDKQPWNKAVIDRRLTIWKNICGEYIQLYEQVIDNYPGDTSLVWCKGKPYLFMAISGNLWRYRLDPGDKVEAAEIPIENVQANLLKLNSFSIRVYGRFWDIETGKKFWPWYEALDPFDRTNQLPLYDAKPSPLHLRDY